MDIQFWTPMGWLVFVLANFFPIDSSYAQGESAKPMEIVPPNAHVGDAQAEHWNRAVLLATPRIASGETGKLSTDVRKAVSNLTLAILATVRLESRSEPAQQTQLPHYTLEEVGVAYSADINGRLTTISSESAARLGANLDFYSRQMLSENEKQLANVKLVKRTSTLAIFDAPSILLRSGQHKDFLTRHLVWIDSDTGSMALVAWLLAIDSEGRCSVAENTLRVVAAGTKEDRQIHVDGRSFFLGIPSARAFALVDLPPGRDRAWTDSARHLAAQKTYTAQDLDKLATALNQLLTAQD